VPHSSTSGVTGPWRSTKVELAHSCDGTTSRKRGYEVATIELITNDTNILSFQPTGRRGDAKQLVEQAAKEGFALGIGVVRSIIKGKGGNTMLSQFEQFSLLQDYVVALRKHAPGGTYILSSTETPGDNRYVNLYICIDGAKQRFALGRHTASHDGCGVRTLMEGTLLDLIGLSPNNGKDGGYWSVTLVCYSCG